MFYLACQEWLRQVGSRVPLFTHWGVQSFSQKGDQKVSQNYSALQQGSQSKNLDKLKARGHIMVTPSEPKDGGGFGPETTNTKS